MTALARWTEILAWSGAMWFVVRPLGRGWAARGFTRRDKTLLTEGLEALGAERVAAGLEASGHEWQDCFLARATAADGRPATWLARVRGWDRVPGVPSRATRALVSAWDRDDGAFRALAAEWLEDAGARDASRSARRPAALVPALQRPSPVTVGDQRRSGGLAVGGPGVGVVHAATRAARVLADVEGLVGPVGARSFRRLGTPACELD